MLDGLVIQARGEAYNCSLVPIYTKAEKSLDVERQVLYYPHCEIHSVVKYYDPRGDKDHKKCLRMRVHRITTQFENFLFSQLSLPEICTRETEALKAFLLMGPEQIYFEAVLGWNHTEGWTAIFFEDPFPFGTLYNAEDTVYIRRKIKLAKYNVGDVTFKFYRMNPDENPEHKVKYPYGWMGLTKCEIETPILTEVEDSSILGILAEMQKIRQQLVGDKWAHMQEEVARKTYARSDVLCAWSANDQNLRGTLKVEESRLTKRLKQTAQEYLSLLHTFNDNLELQKKKSEQKVES
jgi:hypothetical protein